MLRAKRETHVWPFRQRERRSWPRYTGSFDLMYGSEHPLTLTTTIDVSRSGVKFRAQQQLPAGADIEVRLLAEPADPDNGWAVTRATVIRSEAGKIAVQFTRFLADSEPKLVALIERLEASIEHPSEA